MSFNNRNLNPNIWDCRNPQPFGNNQQNFFENNNIGLNFNPRQNINNIPHHNQPQQPNNQIRPLLNTSGHSPSQDHQNFRNFNRNNQDFNRNQRPGPAGRSNNNFSNPPNPNFKWGNRKDDNGNNNNGERSFKRDASIENPANDDPRPKSLVEQLKSTMKKTPRSNSTDTSESIDACARNASKKLFSQLKTMDKDNVKELINNPKQPHKMAVMNIQAREKLREGMRKQLKTLGAEDQDSSDVTFDVEESVNCENIPETLIAQIGRTVDIDLSVEDMDLQNDAEIDETATVDKDMEVVEKNLGNDFLFGSEMLLMNGFSLLGENESEGHDESATDIKMHDDSSRFIQPALPPPLPTEPIPKPPEPVPSPSSSLMSISSDSSDAVLTSSNKPWTSLTPKPPPPQRLIKDFEFNSSRNPDAPSSNEPIIETQPIQVIVSQPTKPQTLPPPPLKALEKAAAINNANIIEVVSTSSSSPVVSSENPLLVKHLPERLPRPKSTTNEEQAISATPAPNFADDDWDTPTTASTAAAAAESDNKTPLNNNNNNQVNESENKLEQRANETYGDYRRRLKLMEKAQKEFSQPAQRKDYEEEDRMSRTSENSNSWSLNNPRNNNNERKSRFEGIRGGRNNNNKNDRRNNNNAYGGNNNNSSRDRDRDRDRDRNNQRDRDRRRDEDMNDAFNYRFDNNSGKVDVDQDRLTNILNPKPVSFKTSFNKRTGFRERDFNRSPSRDRTPVNNSAEREFGDSVAGSVPDIRPCYHTMKKIMEIDNDLMNAHEKIHGIDKVIVNLQSERLNYQKTVTRLMHDRKVLFDVVVKRSMSNENSGGGTSKPVERHEPKEKEKEKEKKRPRLIDDDDPPVVPLPYSTPTKITANKKLANLLEQQKKRKNEEPTPSSTASSSNTKDQDDSIKKKKFVIEEEPKSAQQKQREQEEKERLRRIEEIRRIKQQRKEREAAAQRLLEQQAIKESNDFIPVLKKEPRDKSTEKTNKSKHTHPSSSTKGDKESQSEKVLSKEQIIIQLADVINPADHKIKKVSVKLMAGVLSQTMIDQYKKNNYPEISSEDWSKWSLKKAVMKADKPDDKPEKEKEKEKKKETVKESEDPKPPEMNSEEEKKPHIDETKIVTAAVVEKDPLAIDDYEIINPPTTPGSHLTMEDEEVSMASAANDDEHDYSEWAGNFEAHSTPIAYLQNVDGKYMVCAAECGKLYKYRLKTGKCEATFSMHTQICNSFMYVNRENSVYTASTDGSSFRIKLRSFQSVGSKIFGEPLQVIEKSKYAMYIGAKSGKIFKLKFDMTGEDDPLCCVDSFILCMKASKEGSRHILIVASSNNPIQVRDANDGLLLRTLANDLANVKIYDMLIEGSTIYCGSGMHEIFAIDFTNGALKSKRTMSGAGAICVKLYKEFLIAACYDGNIYIFNIHNDDDALNIAGPSKILLAMDLWDNKIITSTKDTTLKIMNIPT